MKTLHALALATLFLLPAVATAQEYSFDVDPKLVVITFESRMEIEDILGTTHTVSGTARLDPKGGSFRIEVPVDSLRTGIDMRDQHLRSDAWLDAAQFPTIRFEGQDIRKEGDTKASVSGTFTLHGVSKPLSVTLDIRRIPSEQGTKLGLAEGDWVRIRGEFPVKLSDFGVTIPSMAAAKVSDVWTVKVSLFGRATGK
jgi:polyisoprenoid-binding protein YceI